ncbi:hypothetical protein OIU77_002470 [Salix suchowensis]|uniref:Uncharacterized protein n=1 Tax=Salix suchowensis TaxID=1278906 RepID=A0ABQ9AY53_9ROSI|nr:hypothetical protein OIU77_002470 [Salix suchowensis]
MVLFISCIKAFREAKLPGSASEMYNSSEGPLFTCLIYGFLRRIVPWEKLRVSWDNFPYYINEHTTNILVECVASHLKHKKCTISYGARLSSSSGRIMLQSVPGSVEETCLESQVEDDNDAVNEEEWTSSAEAKSNCRDYDAVDLEANAEAALKKLLPCSLEEFEKGIGCSTLGCPYALRLMTDLKGFGPLLCYTFT